MANVNLTPNEMRILRWVIGEANFSGLPWDKGAEHLGYPSAKRARDKWYPLRDKLVAKDDAGAGGGDGKAATGTRRKDSATMIPAATPKKPKMARGTKSTNEETGGTDEKEGKVKAEAGGESDEEVFS